MSPEIETARRKGVLNWFGPRLNRLTTARYLVVFAMGLFVAWLLWGGRSSSQNANDADMAAAPSASDGPALWTCSMHPQIRQPNPGDCPICGMDLIPVVTGSGGLRTLAVSPETRALMSIASSPVERKYVSHEIPMVGKVDFDETKFGYITAWVPGRLDRLFVDFAGVQVNKKDHMVYIYSPELYSAQQELIQALKYRSERPSTTRLPSIDLVESSREKLQLLGLTESQITAIEQQDKPTDHLTIYSPVSGIVIEKLKQEGDYVKTGERIYTVADLKQVWVHLDAYETDLPWIRYGQDVTVTTEAYPGEEFHGRIAFIQPVLNDKTRTVKVRVNVPNPDGKLKPDMFVHAVVRPKVAAGGRVMDPGLAGKWISPMHPEIVKDEPGECDICGMPLVRAESLGYVTSGADDKRPPLVIPYSAAMITGRRAVVYVELPAMPSGLDTAVGGIRAAVAAEDVEQTRKAFTVFSNALDHAYDDSGTAYAKQLWNGYANRLAEHGLAGQRVGSIREADDAATNVEKIMGRLREQFAAPGQVTFEGREIVLGPRAGNYYLVRNGLAEGELVVTQGSFKIDAEIQIQAKPSMMTPEAGGGAGHDHGGASKMSGAGHGGHRMTLPTAFKNQLRDLQTAYEQIADAVRKQNVREVAANFEDFGATLSAVDDSSVTGHTRMQWKEFAMLLSNDVVEGRAVEKASEADRVFLLLKGHMRRMREQLGISPDQRREVEHIAVSARFQSELAAVWQRYLTIQQALAADQYSPARKALTSLASDIANIDDSTLAGPAKKFWEKEKTNLSKLIERFKAAQDITAMRTQFKPLSEEIGVLAKSIGFGADPPIYEIHCPMAFQGKGAVWYQDSDQVRNPYYGSTMLKCADRVEKLARDEPLMSESRSSDQNRSQN